MQSNETHMQNKLTILLQKERYEPHSGLAEQTWGYLVARQERVRKIKLWVISIASIISLSGLIQMLKILSEDITRSGLYEYLSLLFSDGGAIMSLWREFLYSVAESLPLETIALSLTLLFLFSLSLRYMSKQIMRPRLSF